MKASPFVLLSCAALALGGCGSGDSPTIPTQSGAEALRRGEPRVTVPEGAPPEKLIVEDRIEGSGPAAAVGDELTVEYVAVRYDGSPFTNSWERARPFEFELGAGGNLVNPGWERGLPGMRAGGRRELIVPLDLLYRGGAPPGSKPEETLVYVIDLIDVRK